MSEQAPTLPQELDQYKSLDAVVASDGSRRVYGVDEQGKKRQLKGDDVARAFGYDPNNPDFDNPANDNPSENPGDDPVSGEMPNPYEIWGQGIQKAKDKVARKRRVHAHMAADDYAEGHDRLSDNPHIAHLTGEEKKAFALAQRDKQEHADRIAGDGAYDEELERLKEDVGGRIDKEINDRFDRDESTWEFWTGENGDEEPEEPEHEDEPEPWNLSRALEEGLDGDARWAEITQEEQAAKDEYAKLTAKRRKISTLGHKRKLAAAKERYEQARDTAGAYVAGITRGILAGRGLEQHTGNVVREMSIAGAIYEIHDLEDKILEHRLREAGVHPEDQEGRLKAMRSRFLSWWARQGGGDRFFSRQRLVGGFKKSAVFAVPGAIVGAAGAPFIAGAGAVAGLAAAGAISVGRGLARGRVDRAASAERVAREQSAAHRQAAEAAIYQAASNGRTTFNTEDLTSGVEGAGYANGGVEGHTRAEVSRNRKRTAAAAAIGAAAVVGGKLAGDFIVDKFNPDLSKHVGPRIDKRYGSINNPRLIERVQHGDFVTGAERAQAVTRLKGVIGERAYDQLGQQQREALLLLKDPQIDLTPEYLDHLAAGHFG